VKTLLWLFALIVPVHCAEVIMMHMCPVGGSFSPMVHAQPSVFVHRSLQSCFWSSETVAPPDVWKPALNTDFSDPPL